MFKQMIITIITLCYVIKECATWNHIYNKIVHMMSRIKQFCFEYLPVSAKHVKQIDIPMSNLQQHEQKQFGDVSIISNGDVTTNYVDQIMPNLNYIEEHDIDTQESNVNVTTNCVGQTMLNFNNIGTHLITIYDIQVSSNFNDTIIEHTQIDDPQYVQLNNDEFTDNSQHAQLNEIHFPYDDNAAYFCNDLKTSLRTPITNDLSIMMSQHNKSIKYNDYDEHNINSFDEQNNTEKLSHDSLSCDDINDNINFLPNCILHDNISSCSLSDDEKTNMSNNNSSSYISDDELSPFTQSDDEMIQNNDKMAHFTENICQLSAKHQSNSDITCNDELTMSEKLYFEDEPNESNEVSINDQTSTNNDALIMEKSTESPKKLNNDQISTNNYDTQISTNNYDDQHDDDQNNYNTHHDDQMSTNNYDDQISTNNYDIKLNDDQNNYDDDQNNYDDGRPMISIITNYSEQFINVAPVLIEDHDIIIEDSDMSSNHITKINGNGTVLINDKYYKIQRDEGIILLINGKYSEHNACVDIGQICIINGHNYIMNSDNILIQHDM